ncbi:hypothetical protein GCQ56_12895 [Marinifilum sp. N1E240]|uniref:NRDE family protein n=1 Tax=Marinifilum sp. N1E240 TaxID=2608082 RepID=UPI00128E4ECC|nr:NRDE family protein [Marinifilum sp. N1E240]MPQ47902.1 hypothetical protein [Marinifilum sp. N1E240]
MCTLTYIPLGESNYILTTNRDESPRRVASYPARQIINGFVSIFPRDKEAAGTWMMYNETGYSLCLLNGAFVKHTHEPPYKKSRGLVVLEYAKYKSSIDFILTYDFSGIEPFTLVIIRNNGKRQPEELRWDGKSIHYKCLDSEIPAIWSSSTLYDHKAQCLRNDWFDKWKCNKDFSVESILNFHKTAGKGDEINGLVMNRNNIVKTLSVTQVRKLDEEVLMYYEDFHDKKNIELNLK